MKVKQLIFKDGEVIKIKKEVAEPWIVILTHGRAGEELVKSAEMILGKLKNVYVFSLLQGMQPESFKAEVENVLSKSPEGTLVITDLFGGTPSNVSIMLSREYKISVVTGLNIAMLIEADSKRSTLRGDELAKVVANIGKDACKEVTALFNEN